MEGDLSISRTTVTSLLFNRLCRNKLPVRVRFDA
jgi:hypothetical protein